MSVIDCRILSVLGASLVCCSAAVVPQDTQIGISDPIVVPIWTSSEDESSDDSVFDSQYNDSETNDSDASNSDDSEDDAFDLSSLDLGGDESLSEDEVEDESVMSLLDSASEVESCASIFDETTCTQNSECEWDGGLCSDDDGNESVSVDVSTESEVTDVSSDASSFSGDTLRECSDDAPESGASVSASVNVGDNETFSAVRIELEYSISGDTQYLYNTDVSLTAPIDGNAIGIKPTTTGGMCDEIDVVFANGGDGGFNSVCDDNADEYSPWNPLPSTGSTSGTWTINITQGATTGDIELESFCVEFDI